jgi:hypothetical protein
VAEKERNNARGNRRETEFGESSSKPDLASIGLMEIRRRGCTRPGLATPSQVYHNSAGRTFITHNAFLDRTLQTAGSQRKVPDAAWKLPAG